MRIAIFIPTLNGGGAERVMVTLANGFQRSGHRVDLVLVKADGPYLKDVSSDVRIIDLHARGVATALFPLIRYLRDAGPDAMLSAMSHANIVALVAKALSRRSFRLVISERASIAGRLANHFPPIERLILFLMRRTYKRADAVTVAAEAMIGEVEKHLDVKRSRIVAIRNPVVTRRLHEMAGEPPDHPWLQNNTVPVITAMGRLGIEKGFDTLLRAFAAASETRPLRLLIMGEGTERENLEKLARSLDIADRVSLPGFSENPFANLRRSALFVLSSRFEGSPNALVQAMACGVPVISTDCPTGPREILEDGKWGKLVPVGDHIALAASILETLSVARHPDAASHLLLFNEERAIAQYLDCLLPSIIRSPR